MAADFPTGVKTFSTKVDGVDLVQASHINDAQAEIVAIETELKKATGSTVNHAALTNLTTGNPHTQYLLASAVPVKASGADVTAGTDDAKFVTAKALVDANLALSVVLPSAYSINTMFNFKPGNANPAAITGMTITKKLPAGKVWIQATFLVTFLDAFGASVFIYRDGVAVYNSAGSIRLGAAGKMGVTVSYVDTLASAGEYVYAIYLTASGGTSVELNIYERSLLVQYIGAN